MPSVSPQTVKLKSTLRLLIPRLRNAQKKDTALSVASRREMADLLSQSREQSARIRVENIIHTDITVELMEILELYAELLLARAGLLDIRDKNIKEGLVSKEDMESTGLEEAAASIIYAAPRLPRDVRELPVIRSMLVERFGKEFAARAQENVDGCVPVRVVDKLKVDPPSERLVTAYLTEIARSYGVDWPKYREEMAEAQNEVEAENQDGNDGDGDDDDDEGGAKEPPLLAAGAASSTEGPKTPSRATEKLNIGPLPPKNQPSVEGSKSPVSVAPPGASIGNPSPGVRLPGGGQVKAPSQAKKPSGIADGIPTVDDLSARFKNLKR